MNDTVSAEMVSTIMPDALFASRPEDYAVQQPFEKALERLINSYSKENESNTPDFILAQYIMGCLAAFTTAVQQRETWYGRDGRPSYSGDLSPTDPNKEI